MSKFVKIQTELREQSLIKRALDDLKLDYSEDAVYTHRWSGYRGKVDLLVRHGHVTFGLQPNSQHVYEVLADDMQMAAVRGVMNHVQQRYAYHMVVAESHKAGFDLVEEQAGRDQVIRLTLRRWS
jgi:hypothetical protein